MGEIIGRCIHGFGWFTNGSSVTPRGRTRGRKWDATPKRYPKPRPFNAQELRVIELLRAERLAKTLVA